ncbi:protein aardvark-like [Oscarella lobularis]|uniref:protein aardvark-like n=1 Tax=Oscarella lobularis TaxID=121494 RepID=UPI003313A014
MAEEPTPKAVRFPSIVVDEDDKKNTELEEVILEGAGEGPAFTSTEVAVKGQFAEVRSSTVRKTKRKSLRSTKKSIRKRKSDATPKHGRFIREGASVDDIIENMKSDSSDTALQLRCLLAIERLVETDARKRGEVADGGGIEAIIDAMKECKAQRDIQASSCWVLSNLCRNYELNERVVLKGGLDATLEAAAAFHTSEQVQHACLALFCNMALNGETLKKLVDTNVFPVVLKAIKNFPENEWIQFTAVQTVQNLANAKEHIDYLLQSGCVPSVIESMQACPDHDELLQSSMWIFSCMAFSGSDEIRAEMIKQGVLEQIRVALADSEGHGGVCFTGCSALSNIARTDSLLQEIVDAGLVSVLLNALRECIEDESVLRVGCRALVLLLDNDAAAKECKQKGALKLCEDVLDKFPNGPVSVEAKQALKLQKMKDKGCAIL